MTPTAIFLDCDAHVSRHLHLDAGALVIVQRGGLRLCYRDPAHDEWPGLAPPRQVTLQDGESHCLPHAAMVDLRGLHGGASAIIQAPASRPGRGALGRGIRTWLRAARTLCNPLSLEGRP